MRICIYFCCLIIIFAAGCSPKVPQSTEPPKTKSEKEVFYFTDIPTNSGLELSCTGRLMPLRYRMLQANYPGLRELLLRKGSKPGVLNLDTVFLNVPLPGGTFEEFSLTQVQVLPPELSDKYPDIKTYHGKSLVFPEDNIRLDLAPKGISMMIMSTRGTIMIDPYCNTDSLYVISYFRKDLPEGGKEDFE